MLVKEIFLGERSGTMYQNHRTSSASATQPSPVVCGLDQCSRLLSVYTTHTHTPATSLHYYTHTHTTSLHYYTHTHTTSLYYYTHTHTHAASLHYYTHTHPCPITILLYTHTHHITALLYTHTHHITALVFLLSCSILSLDIDKGINYRYRDKLSLSCHYRYLE